MQGDAMNAAEVLAAAHGADVLVHAVNPPGYRRWNEVVLPMIDNSIAAAREPAHCCCCPERCTTSVFPDIAWNLAGDLALIAPAKSTRIRPSRPPRARARSASRWSGDFKPGRPTAYAAWSCVPAIFSGPARRTTGSPKDWSSRAAE